jgi:tetratricopeptide (TPR) repeat protein
MKKHIKPIKVQKHSPPPHSHKEAPKAVKVVAKEITPFQEIELLSERYDHFVHLKKHRNAYTVSLEMAQKTEKMAGLMDITTAIMYFQTANMAFFLKEFKIASQHYLKLITIVEGIRYDKRLIIGDIYNFTAQCFYNINNYAKSAEYNIKAIVALRKKKDHSKEKLCTLHAKVGEQYYFDNKYALSIIYFRKALRIHNKTMLKNVFFEYSCNQMIAVSYQNMNNMKATLKSYLQAFAALEPEKEKYHDEQSGLAHNIGICYLNKAQYFEALDWYQKELIIRKKYALADDTIIGNLVAVYTSVLGLGETVYVKKDFSRYKKFIKTHFAAYL